jgi:hypothetical protein
MSVHFGISVPIIIYEMAILRMFLFGNKLFFVGKVKKIGFEGWEKDTSIVL